MLKNVHRIKIIVIEIIMDIDQDIKIESIEIIDMMIDIEMKIMIGIMIEEDKEDNIRIRDTENIQGLILDKIDNIEDKNIEKDQDLINRIIGIGDKLGIMKKEEIIIEIEI